MKLFALTHRLVKRSGSSAVLIWAEDVIEADKIAYSIVHCTLEDYTLIEVEKQDDKFLPAI